MIGSKLARLGEGGYREGYTLEEAEAVLQAEQEEASTMMLNDIKREEDEIHELEKYDNYVQTIADAHSAYCEAGVTGTFMLVYGSYVSKQKKFVKKTRTGGTLRKRQSGDRYMQCALICNAMTAQFPQQEDIIKLAKATTF